MPDPCMIGYVDRLLECRGENSLFEQISPIRQDIEFLVTGLVDAVRKVAKNELNPCTRVKAYLFIYRATNDSEDMHFASEACNYIASLSERIILLGMIKELKKKFPNKR